jgi:hypothetical protein
MRAKNSRGNAQSPVASEGRLREEIEMLEKRLEQMGPDGDCGYEKALIRFLEQQLGMRREMLRSGAR